MAALVHVAAGFESKPLGKKVPVGLLIAATELLDLLAIGFSLLGVEKNGFCPWSHGLFMAAVWSVLFAALGWLIYRSFRTGVLLGSLVFSHWVIDLITHPMGAVFGGRPLPPDLPLFFEGSPRVGLGLYNHSLVTAYVIELGSMLAGLAIYAVFAVRRWRLRSAAASGSGRP
jgi:hypothetical protein